MTEQEKKEILDELEERLAKKYKGCLYKEDVQLAFKNPREKWFKGDGRYSNTSQMSEAFGSSFIAWQVWDILRKLTCIVCGKQYVRHLTQAENADEVAEKICQFVYDLRMEQKKGEKNEQSEF